MGLRDVWKERETVAWNLYPWFPEPFSFVPRVSLYFTRGGGPLVCQCAGDLARPRAFSKI